MRELVHNISRKTAHFRGFMGAQKDRIMIVHYTLHVVVNFSADEKTCFILQNNILTVI